VEKLLAAQPTYFPPTTSGQHLLDMINATFDYHRDKDAKK
jgi:hypothetical protein